jgi:alkanesulfonate monooxygenase SsuD/methylene tetrahydromethanopterin reductase-like flavin-dependent oxidoreductase (luciferase family)
MGMDGLLRAALVSALHDELEVHVGVYLLALRHPLPVARQVCELAASAPGRLVLGIGVGGEDPHEFEVCGVDPRTRGRRTSESLAILRPLLAGETVTHHGRFFDVEAAKVRPIPSPAVPIVVGGRSPKALERAARHGDGWLGIWSDAKRYAASLSEFDALADACGRAGTPWRHGLQLWAAVDDDRAKARARIARRMEAMYRIPYERFERFAPAGSAQEVADFLRPIIAAGCGYVNLLAVADSTEQMIDDMAAIGEALART